MKFHLDINNTGKAACGAVTTRPDTFVYDINGFNSHYSKEHKCKKCKVIADKENMRWFIENTRLDENADTQAQGK
jgi:hypothetical protein